MHKGMGAGHAALGLQAHNRRAQKSAGVLWATCRGPSQADGRVAL